jgi:HEPN domain-containing protein
MKVITRQWLEYAQTDLKASENNLNDEFVTNIVAFHAQQAVEKAFKALIAETDIEIPRVHNLIRLFSIIEDIQEIEFDYKLLETLDSVYTSSRYPLDFGILSTGKPSIAEAAELYFGAIRIYEEVIKVVNSKHRTGNKSV